MKTAIRIGISINNYDDMTPYQLGLYVQDYNEQKVAENEEKLVLTYLGAYWQRVKRMPSLKQVLGKMQPKKPMTAEEMLEQINRINTTLGGEVR